ncbi:Pre-mRNA-splicing factor SPF27 [Globomyces pollinis-pini]|nr:Pre-mRNA-splicing factor SPF27 [Globomyces pollinis-pini]
MDENGDILFDSLPYLDQDLDLDLAEQLIQKEMGHVSHKVNDFDLFASNPVLRDALDQASKNIKINGIDTSRFRLEASADDDYKALVQNAKSQLEYQENRSLNLDLVSKFGNNAWKIYNYQLDEMVKSEQSKIDALQAQIGQVNRDRKQDQLQAKKTLDSLKLKQDELVSRIIQVRLANDQLEKELGLSS